MAGGSTRGTASDRALSATRDTSRLVRRSAFDPGDDAEWDAVVADVVALANIGGGALVVDGDPAVEADRLSAELHRRTGESRPGLLTVDAGRRADGTPVAVVQVAPATGSPLLLDGRVIVRHGTRTESARAGDLERFVAREVRRVRREWLADVATVTRAPTGSHVVVVPPGTEPPVQIADEVRVVDDPKAPAVGRTDFDRTHPFREVEVVRAVNAAFGADAVGHYDVQCVRRVYDVDHQPRYYHRPKFGSPQYSQSFVDWLVASRRHDADFFSDAKARDQARRATAE
jgi:hypothetical protein